jgi:hypothetical protein
VRSAASVSWYKGAKHVCVWQIVTVPGAGFSQSGSAGLGFQTGNLRSRFPAPFIPFKVADPRAPSLALSCATTTAAARLRLFRGGAGRLQHDGDGPKTLVGGGVTGAPDLQQHPRLWHSRAGGGYAAKGFLREPAAELCFSGRTEVRELALSEGALFR